MVDQVNLSDKLTVNIDGEDRELFMSFALLNRLTAITTDEQQVLNYAQEKHLQEQWALIATLSVDEKGRLVYPKDSNDLVIPLMTVTDAGKLIDWIAEHVLDFLFKRLETQIRKMEQNQPRLQAFIEKGKLLKNMETNLLNASSNGIKV